MGIFLSGCQALLDTPGSNSKVNHRELHFTALECVGPELVRVQEASLRCLFHGEGNFPEQALPQFQRCFLTDSKSASVVITAILVLLSCFPLPSISLSPLTSFCMLHMAWVSFSFL